MMRAGWWMAAVVLVPAMAWADGGSSRTLLVDDDRRQCRYAQFTSIQDAVNAARPGDTIKVCPGLYEETVLIRKPLVMIGSGPDRATDRTANPHREAVVSRPSGNRGFDIEDANWFVVKGFTFEGSASSSAATGIHLIAFGPEGSYRFERNLFLHLDQGLALRGQGYPDQSFKVRKNAFRDGNFGLTAFSVSGLRVEENDFRGLEGGADIASSVGIDVLENIFIGGDSPLRVQSATSLAIERNKFLRWTDIGILVTASEWITVQDNRFREGILRYFEADAIIIGQSRNFEVLRNGVDRIAGTTLSLGILVNDSQRGKVQENVIADVGGTGIRLNNSSAIKVEENKTVHNAVDGIQVTATSSGNRLIENLSFRNGRYDMADENRPANVWKHNWCNTDFPPGTICRDGGSDPTVSVAAPPPAK